VELRNGDIALRRWRLDDAATLAAALHDPEIGRWMPAIPYPYSRIDAETFLDRAVGRIGSFAIVEDETGRLLGGISLNARKWRRAEIGYWVRSDARGRGIAPAALRLISRWGFDQGYRRLQLHADVENAPSQRVAEKAGYTREGVLRAWIEQDGVPRDHVLYSLVASDLAPTVAATHG
jgi:RimJ/RimL family protein N-acetyltransferase